MKYFEMVEYKWFSSLIDPMIPFISKVDWPPVEICVFDSLLLRYLFPVAPLLKRINDLVRVVAPAN